MRYTAREIADAVGGTLYGDETAVATRMVRDNREIQEGDAFFAIRGERFDGNDFMEDALQKGASVCVGQRIFEPACGAVIQTEDTVIAMGRLARDYRMKFSHPVVAVTGSVGKTTTKDMIACALSSTLSVHKTPENFNNEIGLPLTVFDLTETHQAAVLEMGMNHKGELSRLTGIARPNVAVITNIGLSHIENLGSQENILAAKLEILEGLMPDGVAVLNADDPFLWGRRESLPCPVIWYGLENPASDVKGVVQGENLMVGDTVIHMPVPGVHNMLNATCAMAVAKHLGISPSDAAAGIETFRPAGNRQNILTTPQGALLFSDCYNASPAAVKASLGVLAGLERTRKIAVLGDMFELGDYAQKAHYEIGEAAADTPVDILVAVGDLSRETANGARDAGMREDAVVSVTNNKEAIEWLQANLTKDDAILVKGSHGMHMEEIVNTLMEK